MAASGGRNEITTRISLTGSDDVKRQLKDLGQTGEKAFGDINRAAAGPSVALATLSSAVTSAKAQLASMRAGVTPLGDAFKSLSGHLGGVRGSITELANSAVPGLGAAFAGLSISAAGVAILKLATDAANATKTLENTARSVGLTTQAYQALTLVAAQAGVSHESLDQSLSIFAQRVGQARLEWIKLTGQIPGSTQVLRGAGEALDDTGKAAGKSGADAAKALDVMRGGIQGAGADIKVLRGTMGDLNGVVEGTAKVFHGSSQGVIDFSDPLKTLGINLARFKDNAEGQLGLLQEVSTRLNSLGESTLKAEIGSQLFGKGWRDALPALIAAKQGVADAEKELKSFGLLLDDTSGKEKEQATSLIAATAKFNEIQSRVRQITGNTFGQLLTPLFNAASEAIGKNASKLNDWANLIVSRAMPVVQDLAKLIKGANSTELKTDWAKGLLSVLESERDIVKLLAGGITGLLVPAFQALTGAIDLALRPLNDFFGTKFRADTLLGTLLLAKMVGAFAAITAAIDLAKVAFGAFILISKKSPFILLAAAVAFFVEKLTEGTPAAKEFWDSVNGTADDAQKALSNVAGKAVDFGGAAKEAERSVTDALGATQKLGDATGKVAAGFHDVATEVPKAAAGFPSILKGISPILSGLDQVNAKAIDVNKTLVDAGKSVPKPAGSAAPTGLTDTKTSAAPEKAPAMVEWSRQIKDNIDASLAGTRQIKTEMDGVKVPPASAALPAIAPAETGAQPETDNAIGLSPNLSLWQTFRRDLEDIETVAAGLPAPFAVALREIVDIVRVNGSVLSGHWKDAWDDVKKTASDTLDGAKQNLLAFGSFVEPALAGPRKAFDDFFANIGKTSVGQAKLDLAAPELPGPKGFSEKLGEWRKALSDFFAQIGRDAVDDARAEQDAIKNAVPSISVPSLVSSAKADTLGTATGTGTGAATGSLDTISGQLSDAKSALTDFVGGIPSAISDALGKISDLVAQAVEQSTQFLSDKTDALNELFATALDSLSGLINDAISALSDGMGSAFDSLRDTVGSVFDWINSQIASISDLLSSLLDTASSVASFLGNSLGGASGAAGGNLEGFAGGGHVRGPGTATSDSILARLSNYEFVNTARSVMHYGPDLFHALNEMRIPRDMIRSMLGGMRGFAAGGLVASLSAPIMPSVPAFAAGGLVNIAPAAAAAAPGAGKTPVIIQLQDGSQHRMLADDDVAEALLRKRRHAGMLRG